MTDEPAFKERNAHLLVRKCISKYVVCLCIISAVGQM